MPPPLLFRRQKRFGDSGAPSDDAASEKVAFASDTYAPASHALTRLCWSAFAAVACSHGPKATEEVRADIVARHERWLGRIGERAGHLKVRSHKRPHYRAERILYRPSCRRSAELEVETSPVIRRNPSLCTPLQSAAASLPAKPHFAVIPFSESGGPNRSAPSASSSDTASDDDERAMQVVPLRHDAMRCFNTMSVTPGARCHDAFCRTRRSAGRRPWPRRQGRISSPSRNAKAARACR